MKIRDIYGKNLNKIYNECYPERDNTRFIEYKNLLANSISIDGLDFPTETFVKNQLIDVGQVGYDSITQKWSAVYGFGLNELRNPTELFFVMPTKSSFMRKAYYEPDKDGAYLIKAMPMTYSLSNMIMHSVQVMDECDKSILQNLKANRSPFYFVVSDDNTRLSINEAVEQAQNGKPTVVVNKLIGDSVKGIPTNTQWLVDKIMTYREQERDLLFNKLGIMTANVNKRERVQVGEVNATVGQCVDYIYLLIDTFNKQMDSYGLPFKMRLNNALEEYYGTTDEISVENENTLETSENGVNSND